MDLLSFGMDLLLVIEFYRYKTFFIYIYYIYIIEQVKKIDQHAGFVKGVTWDPAGKYLASQVNLNISVYIMF